MDAVVINITDPETTEIYEIRVSPEDAKRAQTDMHFAQSLLHYAKENNVQGEPEPEAREGEVPLGNDVNMEQDQPEKRCWSYNDTSGLIASVEANYDDLHHPRKRKQVWENISNNLCSENIIVSSSDCYKKWQNLVRTYKNVKDTKNKTGRGPSRFLFFNRIDEFLGSQPSNSSPHSIDVQRIITKPPSIDSEQPHCSKDMPDVEQNNSDVKTLDTTRKRKLGIANEYLKEKKKYLQLKQEQLLEKQSDRKEALATLKQKRAMEERYVAALEKLVQLKEEERDKGK